MTDTRHPAPDARPVALTIAGSDSGGGAGIQADLKTMEAHGVFGTSAITAVTAQNTMGVDSSFVLPVEEIEAQIAAVLADFEISAAKTGMLASAPVVRAVAGLASRFDFPLVVDPVMVAASGDRLLDADAEAAYGELIEAATVVTPNADEAEALTGIEVENTAAATDAGKALVEAGAAAALIKGGHVAGDVVIDVLVTQDDAVAFDHPRVETEATHGSGCTLSSAIASRLAGGDTLRDAVEAGIRFMGRAVRYPLDVGQGPGAVHHLVALRELAARHETAEAVEGVVDRLVEADARPLVPEVGMNVAGATPYAESIGEVAAVEGRITRTLLGIQPNRGVRFGASSHVARFLLAAREFEPSLRFAVNCRFDNEVEAALDRLEWAVTEFDRTAQPDDIRGTEGSTMGWGARQAFTQGDTTPAAVVDRGAHGKEPIVKLLATDADLVAERALSLLDAL